MCDARSIEKVAERLFQLDAAEVAGLVDTQRAFEMLLQAPLQDVSQPIVLVIDALDEADPPEQLVEGFKGNVKACGNRTLQLVLKHLVHLPESVRFVFTTRPDAVCDKVQDILARAFEDNIQTFRPEQLRTEADSEAREGGVMVYHTIAKECASDAIVLEPRSCPTLEDVYSAYDQVFAASFRVSDHTKVSALLEVLLAAQEPLPQSLLQQMGMSGTLQQLPGWGVLFFTREHRVYMLHKSLSDWLLSRQLRNQPESLLQLDISAGHLRLAEHLAKSRASPSPYALKYLGLHLSESLVGGHDGSKEILDSTLQDWDFLLAVMKAQCGVYWNRALGGIPKGMHTVTSYDTMRWLKLDVHRLQEDPSMRTLTKSAYAKCAIKSDLHARAAQHEMFGGIKCAHILGGTGGGWGDTTSLFQVS